MVNLGFGFQTLMGVILALAGAGLYFLRTWRPKLARDHDIFFAAIGLLSGGILIFQGWRLDPILAFGQFLLTGSTIFFAAEAISLRGLTTKQAKERTSPYVDEERPVSPFYSYAETELEPSEEYPAKRRIRGARDDGSSRSDYYEDDYRRRPTRNNNYNQPEEPKPKRALFWLCFCALSGPSGAAGGSRALLRAPTTPAAAGWATLSEQRAIIQGRKS